MSLLAEEIPCFHNNLMRNSDLALAELGFIADDVQARQPSTKIITLRPWRDGTETQPHRTLDGSTDTKSSCTTSNVANRGDAYRCYLGNGVFDPCLQNPDNANEYFCPFGDSNVLIRNVKAEQASRERSTSGFQHPFPTHPYRHDDLPHGIRIRATIHRRLPLLVRSLHRTPRRDLACTLRRPRWKPHSRTPGRNISRRMACSYRKRTLNPGSVTLHPVDIAYR